MQVYEARMELTNDLVQLAEVRSFVQQGVALGHFPEDLSNQLTLAVDEACANIIEHAYDSSARGSGRITINQFVNTESFVVVIEDDGTIDFDPDSILDVDMHEHVAAGKKSGLGLFIIRSIMDIIEFEEPKQPGFRNRLRMVRYA